VLLISLACFLLPVFASCAISAILICKTKKFFENKIDHLQNGTNSLEQHTKVIANTIDPKVSDDNSIIQTAPDLKITNLSVSQNNLKHNNYPNPPDINKVSCSETFENLENMKTVLFTDDEPSSIDIEDSFNKAAQHLSEIKTDSEKLRNVVAPSIIHSEIEIRNSSYIKSGDNSAKETVVKQTSEVSDIQPLQSETIQILQIEQTATQQHGSIPYIDQLFELAEEVDSHFNLEAEKKNEALIEAAKRCLQTNAILGLLFLLALISIMIFSRERRSYFSALIFTFMKGSVPVFTTIANFGTVQFVISQYWEYYRK